MTQALAIPLARPVDVESQGTIREGWVSRLAAAFLSLFRANAPSARPQLRLRSYGVVTCPPSCAKYLGNSEGFER